MPLPLKWSYKRASPLESDSRVCVCFYFCVLELISVIESIAKCEKQLFLFMFSLTFCWHLFPLNSSSVLHLDFRLNMRRCRGKFAWMLGHLNEKHFCQKISVFLKHTLKINEYLIESKLLTANWKCLIFATFSRFGCAELEFYFVMWNSWLDWSHFKSITFISLMQLCQSVPQNGA